MMLYSFIFGSLVKLYDEIIDNKIKINTYLLYLIQICIIILGVLICNVDIYNMCYLCLISLIYLLNIYFKFLYDNPIDTYFYIISTFIFIGLFIKNINLVNIKHIFIAIILIIITFIEGYLYSEEYSIFKLISRTNLLISFLLILIFNVFNVLNNFIVIYIGYILTWLIFKQYITNKYVNLIDVYSYIWKKIKKLYKKLKSKKMIKLLQKINTKNKYKK